MPLTQVQPGMLGAIQPYNFKNRLINGAIGVWQRGTSFSSAGGNYTADRWKNDQPNTVVQSSDVPTGLTQYSLDVTQGVSSYGTFVQNIEAANCSDLVAESVTVSFWAKNISGSLSLNVLLRYANSVDNFSSVTGFAGTTLSANPSTSWTYYTVTFNNLPSGVANGLQVGIYRDVGVAQTRYTLIQLEVGVTATSFDYRPYGLELFLCQRYYEETNNNRSVEFQIHAITNGLNSTRFQVRKRTTPTVVVYSSNTGVANTVNNGNGNVQTSISGYASYPDCFAVQMAGTTSQMYTYFFTASAEL